ncbi:hypothetical protein ABIE45_005591 [Methylobacterium sp. OAE515]|uniref:hypothetical protein n=1 Tax=Methylobacterium sp. OAE515 TaxID=2817895 RepID=UPI00178A45B9
MNRIFLKLAALLLLTCPVAAQQQPVTIGAPNSGQGDTLSNAFGKLNHNDADLYQRLNTLNGAAVRFDISQGLASGQQLRGRQNIGAAAAGANADVTSLVNLSGILDAGLGSSRATIAVRGASTWGGLTPSMTGCTFQFNGTDTVCSATSPGTGSVRYDAAQGLTSGQQAQARSNIASAASGANSDITSLSGLTTPLSVTQGGTGGGSASAARASLGLNATGAVAFRNRIINGAFTVNQRGTATASTAYGAGVYTWDRWKAGASGVTASFSASANGDVTASLTAGSLLQIVEGALYLPEGGAYVASWSGTATCRAYQGTATGPYAASPLAITGWTAGTNGTLECQGGTLTSVQLEPGTQATAFERRDDEIRRAQRYYETGTLAALGYASGAGGPVGQYIVFHVPKRATGATVTSGTASISANAASGTIDNVTIDGFRYFAGATAAGSVAVVAPYSAASEL